MMEKPVDTDNGQQTVSDFEIGWMAAMIEAEGSIVLMIARRKAREQDVRITPRVIFTNSDTEITDRYVSILARLGVGRYVRHTRPNNVNRPDALVGKAYKDMTWVNVEGFQRVSKLLSTVCLRFVGEKRHRAALLLRFVTRRLEKAQEAGTAGNRSLDSEDVETLLSFLRLTKTPNYDKIAGMLNEHTREAKAERRKAYKRQNSLENRVAENEARRERRRLRRALISQETARAARNEQPLLT